MSMPPDFYLTVPPQFRDIPLADDPEEWAAGAEAYLAMIPVDRPEAHRQLALEHLRGYSTMLSSVGTVKAVSTVGVIGERLTTASLMATWQPSSPADDADVVAFALLRALSERHRDREVYGIELPVGPAVAMIAERQLTGATPDGNEVDLGVRTIEVTIPVDRQPWVLVMALSSPSLDDWDDYQGIMADACRSIRWSDAPGA